MIESPQCRSGAAPYEALEGFQKAETLYRKIGDLYSLGNNYWERGDILAEQGDVFAARKEF